MTSSKNYHTVDRNEPLSEWELASFFEKWSFQVVNPMLKRGLEETLEFDQLLRIPCKDRSSRMVDALKIAYASSEPFWFMPRLMVALIKFSAPQVAFVAVFTTLDAALMVTLPLLLQYLLEALQRSAPLNDCFMWAGFLSGVAFTQVFVRHSLYFVAMRTGWNWKNASTALIHDKLILMDSTALQRSNASSGMMVNLISNDVARFEEFSTVGMSFFVSLLVVVVVLIELVFVLNVPAAFTGVGTMFLILPAMIMVAQLFAQYRGQTAASTDGRVRYISEVIDGIASVKSYAWETAFFQMIRQLRSKETSYIAKAQVLRAVNQGLMFCTATVVAFATFGVFWGNGGELTIPLVFATISLLHVLRFQIGRVWTKSIETGSEAIASCIRIEKFLDMAVRESSASSTAQSSASLVENQGDRSVPTQQVEDPAVLTVRPSSYSYGSIDSDNDASTLVLKDVSLSVARGELLIVVGPVGSGKSSLLAVALGELHAIDAKQSEISTATTDSSTEHSALDGAKGGVELLPKREKEYEENVRFLRPGCRIAYCAQRPWILAASVKANVTLAGKEQAGEKVDYKHPTNIDMALYSKAVESSLIVDDMMQWPAYDDTEVGERGISVSGGQKARISLARAIYSDADLYLLDDPLSAVDAHVGRALMSNCIVDTLKKGNKATILVTHQLQYLEFADRILVLDTNGNQTFYGSYAQLQSNPAVLSSLDMIEDSLRATSQSAGSAGAGENMSSRSRSRSRSSSVELTVGDLAKKKARSYSSDVRETGSVGVGVGVGAGAGVKLGSKYDPDYRTKMRDLQSAEQQKTATAITTAASTPSTHASSSSVKSTDAATSATAGAAAEDPTLFEESAQESKRRQIVEAEDRVVGTMSWQVYWKYVCSGGTWRCALAVLVIFISQAVLMMADYWLRWWATSAFGDQRDIKYILIFAALTAACVLIGFYRALGWFRFTLLAASNLQEKCLWAVIHSPMTFFVSNPTGRILNRFSRDQNQVDELLPSTIFSFLETGIYCLAAMILICITIPWLTFIIPVMIGIFMYFRRIYIASTREIKRIEAITRSPIYADFSATLDGLTTLRAYKLQPRVSHLFQQQIDENARAYFSFVMCVRWLGMRLDLETATILALVCFIAVALRSQTDVGLLGFALLYTMSLSGLFQWTVRLSVEVETQMTSVERITAYSELPPEDGYDTSLTHALQSPLPGPGQSKPSGKSTTEQRDDSATGYKVGHTEQSSSPASSTAAGRSSNKHSGSLVLTALTATYRRDLDPVLKNLTLSIPAGSKVGICGRTGSGKSSTLLALLRLNIITSGDILLDGESLLAMDLQSARSRLSIIPQDPHLFSGTIRFNLDPFSVHTDTQIWGALQDAHIHDHVRQDPLGLSAVVEESGKNFSVGQRQLLSLARAILRESKVVLMDEVTASIDYLTDRLIQETIRTSPALRDSTIITVAHRLRTIADSDLIVVVQAGEVVEMGAPGTLLLEAQGRDGTGKHKMSHFADLVKESNEYDEIFKIATAKLSTSTC